VNKWFVEIDCSPLQGEGPRLKGVNGRNWEGVRVEMRSHQIKEGRYQVEEFHHPDILSESAPFVTILTLIFKEANQDLDKLGIFQITFSTCQHLQIQFPIVGFILASPFARAVLLFQSLESGATLA
jgi:hypothetical protein